LHAARKDKKTIDLADFEEAKDKVMMGVERKSMQLSEKEKRTTALHESGHAIVGKSMPGTDPVHKVTIIPRGMALGVTMTLPTEDRVNMDREKAENSIAFLMGGRVAEELVLGQKTTGAGNDIERATDIARRMVCEWGMSDVLGPLAYGQKEEQIFLGRDISRSRDFSEQTAQTIDREVRDIVDRNYRRARQILSEKLPILNEMARALLEYETINGDEVDSICRGETLKRAAQPAPAPGPDSSTPVAEKGGETKEPKKGGSGSAAPLPA
jgi:cell division protease FtsH